MGRSIVRLVGALVATGLLACASPPHTPEERAQAVMRTRSEVVEHALAMLGKPYRKGGDSPKGFDCSGLVKYSYEKAGVDGVPRSAEDLARSATPIPLTELAIGDLLFFTLSGPKTSHVAIYVGGRSFVHAPSPGKHVERVSFDHVYWRRKLSRAGSLLP